MIFEDGFEDEEWRDIEGFHGQYRISNHGRVMSVSRRVRSGKGYRITENMIMKQRKDKKGYLRVSFKENGKTRSFPVHRLMALAFIDNPFEKPQVNHRDCDKSNNHVDNLEWCTNGENQKHAYVHGLNYVTGRAGRKRRQVIARNKQTGKIVGVYKSLAEADRLTKINQVNIRKVIIGERKSAGGMLWEEVM